MARPLYCMDLCKFVFVLFFVGFQMFIQCEAVTCKKLTPCSCEYSDGSGVVDLTSLGNKERNARFYDILGIDNYRYSYNPCYPFSEGAGCKNVAACQIITRTGVSRYIPVGLQNRASFSIADSGLLILKYTEETTNVNFSSTNVDLICDKYAVEPVYEAIGGPNDVSVISMQLTHACNCPGLCSNVGIIKAKALSTGSILCILLLCVVIAYVTIGLLYNIFWAKVSGVQIIPNVKVWTAFGGQIKDGGKFTWNVAKGKLGRGEYQKI